MKQFLNNALPLAHALGVSSLNSMPLHRAPPPSASTLCGPGNASAIITCLLAFLLGETECWTKWTTGVIQPPLLIFLLQQKHMELCCAECLHQQYSTRYNFADK